MKPNISHAFRSRLLLPVMAVSALALGLGARAIEQAGSADKSHVDDQLSFLQTELANAHDDAERANLESKIAELEKQRASELDARAAQAAPGFAASAEAKRQALLNELALADTTPLAHLPWIPAGAGFIVEGADPYEKRTVFVPGNDWFREISPGVNLVVWAGADGTNPSAGMVRVHVEGGKDGGLKRVLKTESGALRVESADGSILTMVSADGRTYRFNADTLEFVS